MHEIQRYAQGIPVHGVVDVGCCAGVVCSPDFIFFWHPINAASDIIRKALINADLRYFIAFLLFNIPWVLKFTSLSLHDQMSLSLELYTTNRHPGQTWQI
jgi:hypothetical protein